MDEFAAKLRQAAGNTALLIIDMINDFNFAEAEQLRPAAIAAAERIAMLREAASDQGVPVVHVNDNYDIWQSDRSRIIEHCAAQPKATEMVNLLRPRDDDFFVVKPRFSGFYATNLLVLLPRLGATRLILTGIATDICVLFTAADAHMREYELWVPPDCVASFDAQRTRWALDIMRHSMKAETRETRDLQLENWIARRNLEGSAKEQ